MGKDFNVLKKKHIFINKFIYEFDLLFIFIFLKLLKDFLKAHYVL